MKFENIMKGITYSRNIVAPLKSTPVVVAVIEGSKRAGIVFLIPYFKVEYVIKKFTTLPTKSCGLPINNGINIESEYIEKRTTLSKCRPIPTVFVFLTLAISIL